MAALITAADLGIDTSTDQGLFDWLLASVLFGRPVPATGRRHRLPQVQGGRLGHPGPLHSRTTTVQLWRELWEGDYHRIEFRHGRGAAGRDARPDRRLPRLRRALLVRTAKHARGGRPSGLQRFKGVGPKTAEIFLREVPDALIGTA